MDNERQEVSRAMPESEARRLHASYQWLMGFVAAHGAIAPDHVWDSADRLTELAGLPVQLA